MTPDADLTGPSGEPVSGTTNTDSPARLDPATQRPLPKEIAGHPLPSNFNSSDPDTWPIALSRKDVDRWLFGEEGKGTGGDVLSPDADLNPDSQPSIDAPVDPETGEAPTIESLAEEVREIAAQLAEIRARLQNSELGTKIVTDPRTPPLTPAGNVHPRFSKSGYGPRR